MNSIRRRLTTGLLIGFGLLWAAGGTALYLAIRTGLIAEFDDALRATARGLAALTTQDKGRIEVDFSGEFMPGFEQRVQPDYFQIWRENGATFVRSPSLDDHDLPQRSASVSDAQGWNLALSDGLPGRAITLRFIPHVEEDAADRQATPQSETAVTLVVARHRDALDHQLTLLATALVLVGGALAAVTALLVPAVIGRGLAPLDGLTERAATIDAGSLENRFATDNLPAELQPISNRLNELLARLQASFERERRFSADVAHELRTPIAELRALAEVALKWPDDVRGTTEALHDALDIALQMESIATGLLALARCETNQQPINHAPVEIAPLVQQLWQPLEKRAADRGLRVFFAVPSDVWLNTDRTLFGQIVSNLLSNAVEHSAPGPLEICCAQSAGRFTLSVSNLTNNLGPMDLPKLFERFWRKDAARTTSEHMGIGLALARASADLLGFTLQANLIKGSTLVLSLTGPATTSPPPSVAK